MPQSGPSPEGGRKAGQAGEAPAKDAIARGSTAGASLEGELSPQLRLRGSAVELLGWQPPGRE